MTTVIFALCVMVPDIPVTTTLYVPGGVFKFAGGGTTCDEPLPQPATNVHGNARKLKCKSLGFP